MKNNDTIENKPTCCEIWNEELDLVDEKCSDTWRHGSYVTEVYKRSSDGSFWEVFYRRSSDGETNELREGLAQITQVYPHPVTTIVYKQEKAS